MTRKADDGLARMKPGPTTGRPQGQPRRAVRDGALLEARQRARLTAQMAADALTRAERVAVKPSAVYQWERGERNPPEWAVVALARLYRVAVGRLWA